MDIIVKRKIAPLSLVSPPDEKRTQNKGKNGGDILSKEDVLSPLSNNISTVRL
jgi:hypothetical protein